MKPSQTEEQTGPAGASAGARVSRLLVAHLVAAIALWRLGVFGRLDVGAVGVCGAQLSGRRYALSGHGGVPHVADAGLRNGSFVDGRRLGSTERVSAGNAVGPGAATATGRVVRFIGW